MSWCREVPATPKKVTLAEGTEVNLRMAQDISSRAARVGEPIELTLAEDLKVGDVLVARVGQRALGEVAQGKKPDFWGEAGEVSVRVHFLRVGDKKVDGRAGFVDMSGGVGLVKDGVRLCAFFVSWRHPNPDNAVLVEYLGMNLEPLGSGRGDLLLG